MPGKEWIRDQLKTKSQTLQEDFSWGSGESRTKNNY